MTARFDSLTDTYVGLIVSVNTSMTPDVLESDIVRPFAVYQGFKLTQQVCILHRSSCGRFKVIGLPLREPLGHA